MRIMSCVCIYSISFYLCHKKLTRQLLYVVIYFFCNVFLTIHILVYVITFVLCHHLYLDVCVCPQVLSLSNLPVYYCINISYRKLQIMKFFPLLHFLFKKKYIQNMYCLFLVLFWLRLSKGETLVC
jgi:hypothetical protein